MRTEEETPANQRYLFANEYLSDKAIEIWKSETVKRCKDKPHDAAYQSYIGWERQENEVLIFTLYAYADFAVPKKLDVIFEVDNPGNYIFTEYEIIQSIYEGWLPAETIEDGHKHFNVFHFKNGVPDILRILHKGEGKFSNVPAGQTRLGFCASKDFIAIKLRLEKIEKLKKAYGKTWWEHDDET